jgi:hypothetical protein
MSGPVKTVGVYGIRRLALLLCVACGGLAEDGLGPLSNTARGEDLPTALGSLPERTTVRTGADGNEGRASSAASVARAYHVGEACGQRGHESDASVIVGDVELQEDLRCEAGRSCLMHAREGRACPSGTDSTEAECAGAVEAPFVPVPPPLAPEAAWQGGVCTCRCAGSTPDAEDCVCPRGMSCRALIPSAGVNAAAGPYVGSYCAY